MFKGFFRILIAICSVFGLSLTGFLHLPQKPSGQTLDLDRFELTWSDEFDGDSLDMTKWGFSWWIIARKGGYWHEDMARVENGNLIIKTEYKAEPLVNKYYERWHNEIHFDEYKPGYYSTCITTRDKFEQTYGYFEVRCILPASEGLWSAFWMMNEGVYNEDGTGNDGTEVDVFESFDYLNHKWGIDAISTNLHIDGYGDAHQSSGVGRFFIENDPYTEYNTYGVEWNEDEYIFYINGVETGRTSFGGVSDNPEYLLLSVEVSGENGVAKITDTLGDISKSEPSEFIVDYVRAYQYKK